MSVDEKTVVEGSLPIIEMLESLVMGYEQWEADIISNNSFWWPNVEKDALSAKLYDDMIILQQKRNEAKELLKKVKAFTDNGEEKQPNMVWNRIVHMDEQQWRECDPDEQARCIKRWTKQQSKIK